MVALYIYKPESVERALELGVGTAEEMMETEIEIFGRSGAQSRYHDDIGV